VACVPDRNARAYAAAPRPPNEEDPPKKTKEDRRRLEEDWKKTLGWNGVKKTQAKKTLFKPAGSAHFQNGGGSDNTSASASTPDRRRTRAYGVA
jgi:hypothetical protein